MSPGIARRMSRAARLLVAVFIVTFLACEKPAPMDKAGPPVLPSATSTSQAPPATTNVATAILAPAPSAPRPLSLSVPRATRVLTPSGQFDVDFWGHAVNTHTLLDSAGKGAVPVSEARFLWRRDQLYVAFYAGDLDLEMHEKAHDGALWKDDSVTLSFFGKDGKKRIISASPSGVLADAICPTDASDWSDTRCDLRWESRTRIGVDYDGTINKLGDFDEEWNIQFAIPLRSLDVPAVAGARLSFALKRCDIAFDGQRACGSWGSKEAPGELVLE